MSRAIAGLFVAAWVGSPALLAAPGQSVLPALERVPLEGAGHLVLEARPGAARGELVLALAAGWWEEDRTGALAARGLLPRTRALDAEALLEAARARGVAFEHAVEPDLTVLRARGGPEELQWLAERWLEWLAEAPYEGFQRVGPVADPDPFRPLFAALAPHYWANPRVAAEPPEGYAPQGLLRSHHRRRLGVDRAVLGFAGPFEAEALARRFGPMLGSLAPAAAPWTPPPMEVAAGDTPWAGRLDAPGARRYRIVLAWPGAPEGSPGEVEAELWRLALAGPRLAGILRPAGGRSALSAGYAPTRPRPEPFTLRLDLPLEGAVALLERVLEEVEGALGERAPEPEESGPFRSAAAEMIAGLAERPEAAFAVRVQHLALGLDADRYPVRLTQLAAADPGALAEAARRIVRAQNLRIAIEGPAEPLTGEWAAALAREGGSPLAAFGPLRTLGWPALGAEGSSPEGIAAAERMLAALGGRRAWAELDFIQQRRHILTDPPGPMPRASMIDLRDLRRVRLRSEQSIGASDSLIVLADEQGWRRTALGVEPFEGPVLAAQWEGERRNFARVFARAARGELRLTLDGDGRLEFSEGPLPLLRVALDPAGLPEGFELELGGAPQRVRIESWLEASLPLWPERYTMLSEPPMVFEVANFDPFPRVEPDAFVRPR